MPVCLSVVISILMHNVLCVYPCLSAFVCLCLSVSVCVWFCLCLAMPVCVCLCLRVLSILSLSFFGPLPFSPRKRKSLIRCDICDNICDNSDRRAIKRDFPKLPLNMERIKTLFSKNSNDGVGFHVIRGRGEREGRKGGIK